ncbi:MAG: HD-GYP domain-containing protein, partial [Bythopirellula sp.]
MTESTTPNPIPPASTFALPGTPTAVVPVSPAAPVAPVTPAAPVAAPAAPAAPAAAAAATDVTNRREATQNRVAQISSLLSALEEAASESGLSARSTVKAESEKAQHDNLLAEGRLGMVNSLLKALRYKHPHSAAHSLRVALACSSWAEHINLDGPTRDVLELAALMHDIGKIGATESLLHNPNRLTSEQKATVEQFRQMGLDILSSCCGDDRIIEVVRYVGVRFDGQEADQPLQGTRIPLSARMITIVDSYDAMTTDQVYRPAKARDRAVNELFELSGTQFDPGLVKQFVES